MSDEDATDLPPDLQALIDDLAADAARATERLSGDRTAAAVVAWEERMQRLLARGGQAAMVAGSGDETMSPAQSRTVRDYVRAQFEFLDSFKADIVSADDYRPGWVARAQMYAESIKEPYWKGATRMLPLPAMPTQGTQCLTRCGCSWEIEELDDRYHCYWRRGKGKSCQTCHERSERWSPYVIMKADL